MIRYLSIAAGLLLLALVFSVVKCSDEREKAARQTTNISALLDNQVKLTKDAEGRVSAEKAVAQLERADLLKLNAGKDEQIKNLQAAVKAAGKNAQASTAFRAVTVIKAAGAVDSISYRKPVIGVSAANTPCPLPTYYGTIQTLAYSAKIKATSDTVSIESATTNDFSVTLATKGGLFKRPNPIVTVKAFNPATGIEQVQSWQQPQERPNRGLWGVAGFIAGVVLILAL